MECDQVASYWYIQSSMMVILCNVLSQKSDWRFRLSLLMTLHCLVSVVQLPVPVWWWWWLWFVVLFCVRVAVQDFLSDVVL